MTLRFLTTAALAAAALLSPTVAAQTLGCEVGVANGGLIPASGTGGGGVFPGTLPATPGVFTLNVPSVPPGATVVTEVKLIGLTHTWLADVQLVLTDPGGVSHNLWVRGPAGITSCDWNGDYTIVPPCVGLGLALPGSCTGTTILPPGAYDQFFGNAGTAWTSGTNGIFNTPLDTIPAAAGLWTLTAYDWAGSDAGSLASFDVCFGSPLPPSVPTQAPVLTSPVNNASLFGPVVNLVWATTPCATSYEVEVDAVIFPSAGTTLAYNSTPGAHSWRVRGVNSSGDGPWSAPFTFNDLGDPPTPCTGQELTTVPFSGGNGLSTGSAVYFDVDVLNPAGITVSQFNTNANATVGTPFTLEVWTKPGTYVGSEFNAGAWTLTATGGGVSVGSNTSPGALVEVPDFNLPPGVTGMALRIIGAGHSYTDGNGANQFYSNADLSISLGASQATLFSSTPFTPRVWNGTLRYNCANFPAFCNGDGSGTLCPCGNQNDGSNGVAGCANSAGAGGGKLVATGSSSIAAGDLVLAGSTLQTGQAGLYLQGNNATGGGNGTAFGDGLRCAGGGVVRLQIRNSGMSGSSFTTVNIGSIGGVAPGDVKRYQLWFRDTAGLCGSGFNFTNGVEVTWAP